MIKKRDRLLAKIAGATISLLIIFFGVSGADPSMWEEMATVSWLRPPQMPMPGMWRWVAGWFFPIFGYKTAVAILSIIGALVAGFCVSLFYLIIRMSMNFLVRFINPVPVWTKRIAPFFSFVGAILLGLSDPYWIMAQIFSTDQLRFLIAISSFYIIFRWFVVGGALRLYSSFALMGFLAAESPFGFLMPILFIIAYFSLWHGIVDGLFEKPANLPVPEAMPKWRMFFTFLGGIGVVVWLNVEMFMFLKGSIANGWDVTATYFHYGVCYWRSFMAASTLLGWILGVGFCALPLVVALRVFPMVTRDDCLMMFGRGVVMFFIGFLATMQSGLFDGTRFWTFSSSSTVINSGFLLCVFIACAMFAMALFLSTFTLACQAVYITKGVNEDGIAIGQPNRFLKLMVPGIAVIIVAICMVRGTMRGTENDVLQVVNDVIDEVVDECEGVDWLFTDGRVDPAIELAATSKGHQLTTLNLMSGSADWEVYIRCRGLEKGSGEYNAAETGVPVLLRVWAGEKTNGLENVALQLGFDYWRRERKALPTMSGLVARNDWPSLAVVSNGIARAEVLSARILELSNEANLAHLSPALASAFSAINWRLSRFAHLRGNDDLGDDLDRSNAALEGMLLAIEAERQRTFMQLTPREGLRLALRRTNFIEAARYAAIVLRNDDFDPEANFAMGMNAVRQKRMPEAEMYLRKCLKRREKDPAIVNNLSIVCRKQRKYKEAEDFARKAIELLPGSREVQRTLSDALKRVP